MKDPREAALKEIVKSISLIRENLEDSMDKDDVKAYAESIKDLATAFTAIQLSKMAE